MPQGLAGLFRAPTCTQQLPSFPWLLEHPLPLEHMPSVYFPSPIWPHSFSLQPSDSPMIPSHFQSGLLFHQSIHPPIQHGSWSTFQDLDAIGTKVGGQVQSLSHSAEHQVHKLEWKYGNQINALLLSCVHSLCSAVPPPPALLLLFFSPLLGVQVPPQALTIIRAAFSKLSHKKKKRKTGGSLQVNPGDERGSDPSAGGEMSVSGPWHCWLHLLMPMSSAGPPCTPASRISPVTSSACCSSLRTLAASGSILLVYFLPISSYPGMQAL